MVDIVSPPVNTAKKSVREVFDNEVDLLIQCNSVLLRHVAERMVIYKNRLSSNDDLCIWKATSSALPKLGP